MAGSGVAGGSKLMDDMCLTVLVHGGGGLGNNS